MRRKAETVNFVAGGRWDDESVGTNALDLANRLAEPAMVFSAEHYASIVHNWVCWAAPGPRPRHRRQARRHRPLDHLGPHPPDRARDRAGDGPADRVRDAALGPPPLGAVRRDPRPRPGDDAARHRRDLPRRAAAAAQPAPDRGARAAGAAPRGALARAAARDALRRPGDHVLHAQGRGLAPARRARRPARLAPLPPADAGRHRRRARRSRCCAAARSARPSTPTAATCCPAPTRPALSELAEYVAVAVREALLVNPQPDAVVRYSELAPYDSEVLEVCLASLDRIGGRPHPAVPLLKGRLAVARR